MSKRPDASRTGASRRIEVGTPLPEAAWSIDCDFEPEPTRPNHDKPETVTPPYRGVPIGGFGAGTIGRTYRGDFAQWHVRTGTHVYRSIPACSQALAVHGKGGLEDAFAIGPKPKDGTLGTWTFRRKGIRYDALYPLAWYSGTAARNAVSWRMAQYSPILPENYRETSLPVAVFRWHLANTGSETLKVSIATSWENVSLVTPGTTPGMRAVHVVPESDVALLWMGRAGVSAKSDEEGAFAIAAAGGDSFCVPSFDATGDGAELWAALTDEDTAREYATSKTVTQGSGRCAGGLGITVELPPRATREVAFSLAWHFPVFRFGSGRGWYRRYTKFYSRGMGRGDGADPACRIAVDALKSREQWLRGIEAWQAPILTERSPALARALFNSLYILADGGTAWENGEVMTEEEGTEAPPVPGAHDIGRFSVLECFTYPYYATLDVRYYGGLPLLFFWPELERQVLLQFAAAAGREDRQKRDMQHVREQVQRKRVGTLPHDLGSPDEDPWVKINAYDDIDPNRWKDLSPKFVLQAARYMARVGWEDRGFLHAVWQSVRSAMIQTSSQDRNGDWLPDNEGIPDQTFDKWPMRGASAYCSGLVVNALAAAAEIANWCGDQKAAREYKTWRDKAVASYLKKLWCGDGFQYDEQPVNKDVVMAAQLSGEWGIRLAGLPGALDAEKAAATLSTIWDVCRVTHEDRFMGLRNGGAKGDAPAPTNRHANEVWPGINYVVAAELVRTGMTKQADELVEALSRVIFTDHPFAFATPEAWNADGAYRGLFYLRPTAVWAVEEALRRARPSGPLRSFFDSEAADGW